MMNKQVGIIVGVTLLSVISLFQSCKPTDKIVVENKIVYKAIPFDIADITLLDGPFKVAREANENYLLELKPDRFLYRWRKNAGLAPKDSLYGGWEANSSHMLGHYLSGLSYAYAANQKSEFKERVDYIVNELFDIQVARGTGYVGGCPNEDKIWKEVLSGDIRSSGFDLNGGWVPWYMLHKTWQGLLDAYFLTDSQKAKEVVVKMSDWVCDNFTPTRLNDELFQKMLNAEFGGMNDALAQVYQITGDKKYLDMAYRFEHKILIEPLEKGNDCLAGMHANTQIPKVLGNVTEYEATGNERERRIAEFFWERVVNHHSFAIGGNSCYEWFTKEDEIARSVDGNTAETCNTYNMLKMTKKLFTWNAEVKYADYYEKALFNHILASINPETGMTCYYVHLGSGKEKVFCSHEDFWCCTGTGLENPGKYGEAIYFEDSEGGLFVNLFMASELNWKKKGVKIRQETNWPLSDETKLTIVEGAEPFAMKIRYPGWAKKGIEVLVNDEVIPVAVNQLPGTYVSVDRKWRKGDVVTVRVPMGLELQGTPEPSNKYNVFYGPIVLGAELGNNPLLPIIKTPVLLTEGRPVTEWVQPVNVAKLKFKTVGVGMPNDVTLAPFYSIYNQKHIVYFDLFSKKEWEEKRPAFEHAMKTAAALEAITTDYVALGEQQPEKDHNLIGQHSNAGEWAGRRFRIAYDGGFFEFDAKVNPDSPLHKMTATYFGGDKEDRQFDILVEGIVIGSEKLCAEKPDKFVDRVYTIPADLIKGKKSIKVRFQAKPQYGAGGVFGVRITTK